MSPMKLAFSAFVAVQLAAPVQAFDLNNMSDQEREIFRKEVRDFLMDQPEVIIEAVNQLEAQKQEALAQADFDLVKEHAGDIFEDGYSYVGGNPDGDITMVEFLDYRCGYCRKAHNEVAKLLETDKNIKLIIKEFPILGEQSSLSAQFAVAVKQVAGTEAYKNVSDALMSFTAPANMASLSRLGESFGLDMEAVEAKMNSPEVAQELSKTNALARKLRITGTPTFVLQDEMLRGYLPYDQLKAIIEEKRG